MPGADSTRLTTCHNKSRSWLALVRRDPIPGLLLESGLETAERQRGSPGTAGMIDGSQIELPN